MKKIINDLVNIFRNRTGHRKTDFKKNRRLYRFGLVAFYCLAFGVSFLFSQGMLYAASVTLAWDASSGAAGYKIYYGTTSHNYSSVIDVRNATTYTFTNLVDGRTYYFAATAYDSSNYESDYSSEVSYNSTTTTAPTSYTITASAGTGGTISPSGSVSITSGASRTFTITANSGYIISNVTVNGSSVGAVSSYTFSNVTANRTIAATFVATSQAQTYALSTNSTGTGTGTITRNPTGTTFRAGTVVTLTAIANANSLFTGWTGACSGTSTTCQVTMNSNTSVSAAFALRSAPTTGDFNNDGSPDILWRNTSTGANLVWYMENGTTVASSSLPSLSIAWALVAGTADFNKDGRPDILWRNTSTGANMVWYMNGTTRTSSASLPTLSDTNWQIVGVGDFNNDGRPDILWRYSTGLNAVWYMNGTTMIDSVPLTAVSDTNWQIVGN